MKVGDALRALDAREARILLAKATGFSEASIVASPDRELTQEIEQTFAGFVARRAAGEPIAYIVGHKEFYGIDLLVNPAVLIPRPETELLVELALQENFSALLDLGTGSGAIALAVKWQRREARVVAVEASAAALVVARRNAERLGLAVDFRHGEWFGPLAGERFDIIVGNPPYVAEDDPHLDALRHEPVGALVSGADGLAAIRQILAQAPRHLAPGGALFIEHGLGQDEAVRRLFLAAGLEAVASRPDLSGIPRVTGGRVK